MKSDRFCGAVYYEKSHRFVGDRSMQLGLPCSFLYFEARGMRWGREGRQSLIYSARRNMQSKVFYNDKQNISQI